MERFLLYEEVMVEEEKKAKLLAEVVKFRNGKIVASFSLGVPSIFIFDNLDQFTSVYCNDKVKLHLIEEKKD